MNFSLAPCMGLVFRVSIFAGIFKQPSSHGANSGPAPVRLRCGRLAGLVFLGPDQKMSKTDRTLTILFSHHAGAKSFDGRRPMHPPGNPRIGRVACDYLRQGAISIGAEKRIKPMR